MDAEWLLAWQAGPPARGINQGAILQERVGALAWAAVLSPSFRFTTALPRSAYVARAFAELSAACSWRHWVGKPKRQTFSTGGHS